jgi:serine/threonine-protein kinase HipA
MSSPLLVSVSGVEAGLLHPSNEGSFFELDETYLRMAERPVLGQQFEDDPGRPHRSRQGVPPWFANLLPEGPLRDLIADRAGVDKSRSLFLLRLLGDDLPGAVTVTSTNGDQVTQSMVAEPELDSFALLRFSLAGVQIKFSALRAEDRGLTIPVEGRGGNWIVKLPDQRFPRVPENEYSMMEWARMAGIDVPETQLTPVGEIDGLPDEFADIGGQAFAIRRFDRLNGGRIHIEDFAQVLGIPPRRKYGATNFDTILRTVFTLCGLEDAGEFIRRLVFMIAIGNSDAHAKNWSLIYPDGHSARLAPAYDLVAVSYFESLERLLSRQLALKLAGVGLASEVNEETFRKLADRSGLDRDWTVRVVHDAIQHILDAWEQIKETLARDVLHPPLMEVIEKRLTALPLFRSAYESRLPK